jgi:hypothetical protein
MGGLRSGWLGLWMSVCSLPALAAEPDPVKARAEANTAADKLDEHHYAEALEHAEKAEAFFHAPSNVELIARAQEGLGRLCEAMASYERIATEPLPASAPDAFRASQTKAKQRLVALMARVPSLRVVVHGDASTGARVAIDGKPYDASAGAVRVDPGAHTVTVTADGFAIVEKKLDLVDKGGVVTVDVTPERGPAVAPIGVQVPSADASAASLPDVVARGDTLLAPGVALVAVGGAALVAGAAVGGVSLAKVAALKSACREDGACPAAEQSTIEAATGLGNASTALVVIGAASAATGAALLIVRAVGAKSSHAALHPWIGAGMAGIAGSFR